MAAFRPWFRRLSLGIQTIFGFRRRGFFIPYRYADSVLPGRSLTPYASLEKRMAASTDRMTGWLNAADGFAAELLAIGDGAPPAPRWSQDWFPRADAAMAYTIARTLGPRRIVEIGCGHSTRFFARALEDGGIDGKILAIDPAPRADLAGVARIELRRATLQDAGISAFGALKPGDILAIDSSHILMPGTDVDILLNRVLPDLPAGCYLHIHDIFLPDPYPADWEWRGYNEQNGVGALLAGGGWHVEFASHYAVTRLSEPVANSVLGRLPLVAGARESSFWLKKL
jgi:hypothetical protein